MKHAIEYIPKIKYGKQTANTWWWHTGETQTQLDIDHTNGFTTISQYSKRHGFLIGVQSINHNTGYAKYTDIKY